jgi:amicoumacin kinase
MKLTKQDFEEVLENYDVGKLISCKRIFTAANLIYKIDTRRGKFVLKIYLNSPQDSIKNQIELMDFLNDKGIVVPKNLNTLRKEPLLLWKGNKITIQEFIEGQKKQYVNKELAKDMGKKYGALNKSLSKYKTNSRKIENKNINQFNLLKWKTISLPDIDIKEESKKVINEIKKLNERKLSRTLIHGDLGEGNFLVKDNKISAILDFDNINRNYLVCELAVPISQNFITLTKVKKDLIRIFLKEYQKDIKLNNEEKKALYLFVKYQELFDIYWCYNQIEKFPKEKNELMKWTRTALRQYQLFNKISLEEWLEILK